MDRTPQPATLGTTATRTGTMPDSPILLRFDPTTPPVTLDAARALGTWQALEATLADGTPSAVLQAVEDAGLRGRGGACFPTAKKWHIAAASHNEEKYVVANGGEHEPGSGKDKYLVANHPHAVLEGMVLCGYATGASKGILYLIEDMAPQIAAAEQAIQEARAAGLLGSNICGSKFDFEIDLHKAPTTYVAGEETAAIDSIEGGPGKPKKKPPYPGVSGVHGRPTTVNNVETLALVPWIVQHGAEAFAAIGTDASKGTMLFTLGERANKPGVYEVPFGTTFREVIETHGGGTKSGKTIRAFLPALSCAWLEASHLDTPVCVEGLRALGSSPGCGGISWVEEGEDPVPRLIEIAEFFMKEQCGQCPPCRMETNQFVHILKAAQAGKAPDAAVKLNKLAKFARGKGLCSLIEMAAAPVISGLTVFGDEFANTGEQSSD